MQVLGDREIEESVRNMLAQDSRVDVREINVRVENGVVYVSGAVDSAAERRAIQEDLESVLNVGRFIDTLTLRNYVERTNEELAASVMNVLVRDRMVDASDIAVNASDCRITLNGRVGSYAQKRAAEEDAWWTPGVVDVVNRLQVDGFVEPPLEPDY